MIYGGESALHRFLLCKAAGIFRHVNLFPPCQCDEEQMTKRLQHASAGMQDKSKRAY